jgi:hypothetical protein
MGLTKIVEFEEETDGTLSSLTAALTAIAKAGASPLAIVTVDTKAKTGSNGTQTYVQTVVSRETLTVQ